MFATKFDLLVALSCVLTLQVCHIDAQKDPGFGRTWNYSDSSAWPSTWPQCGGRRQSPIDIDPSSAVPVSGPVPNLQFIGYDAVPSNMTMTNTGDEVQMHAYYPEGQIPHVEGGLLTDHYIFKQLNFHWGPNDDEGSEHTVEGRRYAVEIHMVHIKREYLSDEDAAYKNADGFLTVARFYNVTPSGEQGCIILSDHFSKVTEPGTEIVIKTFPVTELYLYDNDDYWTYNGSLTAPNCAEVVTWVIPTRIMSLGSCEIETLRTVKLSSGEDHNNRPTQPLDGRTVSFVPFDNSQ